MNTLPIHSTRRALSELKRGEAGTLESLDVPEDTAQRLMELGFLPGARVTAGRSAPGGDPMVFEVDGSDIALRRETAGCLKVRIEGQTGAQEEHV